MFIYETTNLINGKKYIGMCTREDSNYLGSGILLKQAIDKYGKENFQRRIVETCDTFEQLCEAEAQWITDTNAVESDQYYNLIEGGLGGNTNRLKEYWGSFSPEERKQIRNWKPHFKINPPVGEKNPNYGKSSSKRVKKVWDERSEEQKQEIATKVSNTRRTRQVSVGSNNNMYGRSAIQEQNLKWYTNGIETIYVTEGTQPSGFYKGRTLAKRKGE